MAKISQIVKHSLGDEDRIVPRRGNFSPLIHVHFRDVSATLSADRLRTESVRHASGSQPIIALCSYHIHCMSAVAYLITNLTGPLLALLGEKIKAQITSGLTFPLHTTPSNFYPSFASFLTNQHIVNRCRLYRNQLPVSS